MKKTKSGLVAEWQESWRCLLLCHLFTGLPVTFTTRWHYREIDALTVPGARGPKSGCCQAWFIPGPLRVAPPRDSSRCWNINTPETSLRLWWPAVLGVSWLNTSLQPRPPSHTLSSCRITAIVRPRAHSKPKTFSPEILNHHMCRGPVSKQRGIARVRAGRDGVGSTLQPPPMTLEASD